MNLNEEIDEAEFYHQDFTTASEWEIFISRMEEAIREWKLEESKSIDKESALQGQWLCKSENLLFADIKFQLNLYVHKSVIDSKKCENDDEEDDGDEGCEKKSNNPLETDFDFVLNDGDDSNADKCISTWYGLKKYIVLVSTDNSVIVSPSRIKILLSSAVIAIANTNCEIPIFVQIREKWQKLYLGIYEGDTIRTNYDMIHLGKCPQHCRYLSGLLDLFKTKIMSPLPLDTIMVSVQLTYHLMNFGKYVWRQELPDLENYSFDANSLIALPFGVTFDPISCIMLKAVWSQLPDHLVVDSEIYSDLDPMQAPLWTATVRMTEQPVCLLADCLTEFIQLLHIHLTIHDVLGDFVASINNAPDSNPLDLLTEPHIPSISSVLRRATRNSLTTTRNRKIAPPIPEESLEPLIYFLFPDAESQSQFPYNSEKLKRDKLNSEEAVGFEKTNTYENAFKGYKTCGHDTLVWRLSIVLAQAVESLGGTKALAHFWYEFAQEMRYRWEKGYLIPGLAPGFPDPRTCLLHQKLQMLNCCIERKMARESKLAEGKSFEMAEDASTDDEEFFDCDYDNDDPATVNKKREAHSLWNQPVGRLTKFENLKLLKNGDPLYIPITQEPVPKTEDQLEEDTDVLLKLGSDAQGSELRARMMSASLLSDMESFKAANPGSVLEDFIRWYSPRDWIEDDGDEMDEWGQKKGHLSSRMLISDNTWVEMWESAKPVPANRQKRLFDDTREAEKVLHFLDSRNLAQIGELILPVLCHSAIYRLLEESEQAHMTTQCRLRQIIKTGERISREGAVSKRRYEALIQEIGALELSVSQINSLLYKFNPAGESDGELNEFAENLTRGLEMEIRDKSRSKVGASLLTMFSDAQKAANMTSDLTAAAEQGAEFPPANEREFVMRVSACRPAAFSTKSPQFLRAVLTKNEFRLCGAFSEDMVFF